MRLLVGFALALAVAGVGCRARKGEHAKNTPAAVSAASVPPAPDRLAALRAFENSTRAKTDFVHEPTSETALGTDPYVIRPIPNADRAPPSAPHYVGLLRGRAALVELDADLNELHRLPAPESPTGLAVGKDGTVFVVGELSSRVARYRRVNGRLERGADIELPGVRAMRDVATSPEGLLYVSEEHDGRLLTVPEHAAAQAPAPVESSRCHGPIHVLRLARSLLVDCLLDHTVVASDVDARGFPVSKGALSIHHDGPMWGMDGIDDSGGVLVAVGGVEDHPLDRTQGSFGFVDSFATVYRLAGGNVVKLAEVNTSELGVVTPKALRLWRPASGGLELAVAGYASDHMLLLDWSPPHAAGDAPLGEPSVKTIPVPPGTAMMDRLPDGTFVAADPLIDAWVRVGPERTSIVHVDDEMSRERSTDSRIGEALFFTTLMAPWNKSEGRLSRFTCETCHFEGYDDGRTHFTGRSNIYATTKPLLGLFNNRPHFSRALDPDLTTMVNNEFRVANAKSDHDSWFSLPVHDFAWLKELGVTEETLSPEHLRRALMSFFMIFSHRPNPSVVGRDHFTDVERRGSIVFRDKCESCHEARLVADDPTTRQPFETWEERVMSPQGPIVWAHSQYAKTGVEPYVNPKGTRVVSLRRLYKKYPYFTNGSAKSLRSVLDRVGMTDDAFFHDRAPKGARALSDEEKTELAAFLDLL